jgi:hypothetical protein
VLTHILDLSIKSILIVLQQNPTKAVRPLLADSQNELLFIGYMKKGLSELCFTEWLLGLKWFYVQSLMHPLQYQRGRYFILIRLNIT